MDEHYTTAHVNSPVILYDGPLLLKRGLQEVHADGLISIKWRPSPKVTIDVTASSVGFLIGTRHVTVEIPQLFAAAEVLVTRIEASSDRPTRLHGILNSRMRPLSTVPMSSLQCHIASLEHFLSPIRSPLQQDRNLHQMVWLSDRWKLEINAVPHLDELVEELNDEGGSAITHDAVLTTRDRSTFSADDAEAAFEDIFYFLCFVQGRRSTVILPRGFDADGKCVWRQWASWHVDSWKYVFTWADLHHGTEISDAFAGYFRLMDQEGWRQPIQLAIYWYMEANKNSAGLEAAVVLTQMALEALAWEVLVQQRALLTADAFQRLHAPDRIRLLCGLCEIPVGIPAELKDLQQAAKEFDLVDIAGAIVFVRNNLVHPNKKQRPRIFQAYAGPLKDAWTCGLWMLELILLRLFDYNGPYSDRRALQKFAGATSPVPWVVK